MKKIILAAAMAAAFAASAELRIGTVEMLTLVRNHPNYDSNKSLLTDTEKDYQKKLDVQKKDLEELQEQGRKLAEQYRNPMLAAKAKADLEKQLTDIQQKLVAGQQRLRNEAMRTQQELQDLEGRLLKATTEDLRKRISAFAEKNGYDFVLDSSASPFARKSFDVTDKILESMGVDPSKAKTASSKAKK